MCVWTLTGPRLKCTRSTCVADVFWSIHRKELRWDRIIFSHELSFLYRFLLLFFCVTFNERCFRWKVPPEIVRLALIQVCADYIRPMWFWCMTMTHMHLFCLFGFGWLRKTDGCQFTLSRYNYILMTSILIVSFLFHLVFQHTKRTGWLLRNVNDCETVAGHMYRMSIMTFLLDGKNGLDRIKCMELGKISQKLFCSENGNVPNSNWSTYPRPTWLPCVWPLPKYPLINLGTNPSFHLHV